jgi:NTP pyrophosphatase (non-canonical NTP hydrolase)|tara:strand:+ start:269 stop:517 length:249 start_codon:yes stop_codon:yes gene_type:complete
MALKDLQVLVLTMEECGELIRACSKVIRHGTTNDKYVRNLVEEMGDVDAMIRQLRNSYDIDPEVHEARVDMRLSKMEKPDYV